MRLAAPAKHGVLARAGMRGNRLDLTIDVHLSFGRVCRSGDRCGWYLWDTARPGPAPHMAFVAQGAPECSPDLRIVAPVDPAPLRAATPDPGPQRLEGFPAPPTPQRVSRLLAWCGNFLTGAGADLAALLR